MDEVQALNQLLQESAEMGKAENNTNILLQKSESKNL